MKTSKKIISVILAVIMVIGSASTAFAAIDTSKSVDSLIEQENIATVAEYLLKNINSRKNEVTGTVLRLAFLFIKNTDLDTFIAGRDVTTLSDEQNAEILVKWLDKLLKDNTASITQASWYGLAQAACTFLGIKLDLSNIDGAIRTLYDACNKCANPGLIGVAIDFADLGKLNGSALKNVSVKASGNLGVVKALINWVSDNTYVVKQLVKGKLDAGSLNDKINIDKINGKVNEYIGKDAIMDKMYRLVYGGAKDGDFAKSAYNTYTADQLLAAGFIKMMRCTDATHNIISKEDCDEALGMTVYELLAKYGPVFLENYKFKKDGKTIVEKLNDVLGGLISSLKNEPKVDDDTKARFEFKAFTNGDFTALFNNLENDGILNQFNNVCCLVAKKILSAKAYAELGLVEGGNEKLNDNLTKICRYTLPAIAKVGEVGGVDFSAFGENAVKNMTLAEMGTAVLKLFFPNWFKDNFDSEKDAVNKAKTIDQLAVIAAKLALTNDKWIKFDLTEPDKINLAKIDTLSSSDCKEAILKMGAEVAALTLDHNKATTYFTLETNRTGWTYKDYLNAIVNWGVNFIKGIPAVFSAKNFYDDKSNPFYKINVALNELIDFSFIDAGDTTFKLDVETLIFDNLLGNLFNMDLEGVFNTFKKNNNKDNILNGTIVKGVVSVLDKALTAMFEHNCTVKTTHEEKNLGNCVYQDYSYSYCATCGHYTEAPKTNGAEKTAHKFGAWVIKTPAVCGATEKGLRERVCSECGKTESEAIIKNNSHRLQTIETVAATAEKDGYTLKRCACGYEKKDIIPKLAPTTITVTENAHIKVNKDGIIVADTSVKATAAAFGTNAKIVKADGSAIDATKDALATGMKLVLTANGKTLTKEIAVLGDIDGNGEVSVSDARNVLRAAVQLDTLSGAKLIAADVDFSKDISVGDARNVLRAAVGLDKSDSWIASYK